MKENKTKHWIVRVPEKQPLNLHGLVPLFRRIEAIFKKAGPVKKITITAQIGEE